MPSRREAGAMLSWRAGAARRGRGRGSRGPPVPPGFDQAPRIRFLQDLRGEGGVQRVPAAVGHQVADRPDSPTSDRSPITSRILWRTNSSSNRSALFSTPVSPSTIALSSEPPSARPRCRSISTSFRNPNVRAGAMSSTNALFGDPHRPRLVPQQRMVEADAVGDLEVIRRVERDALVAVRQRNRPQRFQVTARRLQPLDAGFVRIR